MKKLFKILVYIVFVTFVAPSFYIFLTTLHKKVVEEKVPFQEVAARAPEYSFLPVTNFWLQQYNRFFVESEIVNYFHAANSFFLFAIVLFKYAD